MKVKRELLQAFLDKYSISAAILAREMGVSQNVGEENTVRNAKKKQSKRIA